MVEVVGLGDLVFLLRAFYSFFGKNNTVPSSSAVRFRARQGGARVPRCPRQQGHPGDTFGHGLAVQSSHYKLCDVGQVFFPVSWHKADRAVLRFPKHSPKTTLKEKTRAIGQGLDQLVGFRGDGQFHHLQGSPCDTLPAHPGHTTARLTSWASTTSI